MWLIDICVAAVTSWGQLAANAYDCLLALGLLSRTCSWLQKERLSDVGNGAIPVTRHILFSAVNTGRSVGI